MNPLLKKLHPYPFEKLAKLKSKVEPDSSKPHIALSIGEPKHSPPRSVLKELENNINRVSNYAATRGLDELREAISTWAMKRFKLKALEADTQVLPVNGTREALFAITQALVKPGSLVLMPNPFYQIYEGAAFLAGAEARYINCPSSTHFLPDFDSVSPDEWRACDLLFLCSPGNPTGTVLQNDQLQTLIQLADKYDFYIASDECYSELYFDEDVPPTGLLRACADMGRHSYERCLVFHSLSKRSNLPGLRSGFVAGDANLIAPFLLYRTYHGCAMPIQTQMASIKAWSDEQHVFENRELYRQKFARVLEILDGCLDVSMPDAGFYLWPHTPLGDEVFAQKLFEEENVTVLPGSYLARDTESGNPGANYVRMALVASLEECENAARRIHAFMSRNTS